MTSTPDDPVPPRRRSWREALAVATAVLALAGGLGSLVMPRVPSLQTVLQQSFTRQPSVYTELYFTRAPSIDGVTVSVPVTVVDHNTGTRSYQVRVVQESDRNVVLGTSTTTLVPHNGRAVSVVVRLAFRAGATQVKVTLPGHPQSLHYRIAGAAVAGTGGAQ